MDKLKENAYWIAVGTTVVVLLLLAWYLVLGPIYFGSDSVEGLGAQLKRSLSDIEAYTKREFVPTEEYEKHLKEALDREREDHNDAVRYYNGIQERFNEYFDGRKDPPPLGQFASLYHEKIKELVDKYRSDFNIKPPEEDDTSSRRDRDKVQTEVPDVARLDQAMIHSENISLAMKEYWIIESIFKALNKLGIGGLKKIEFPGRLARDEGDDAEHYKRIDVALELEIPFSQITPLVTQLFSDQKVLFLFDGVEVTKTVEHLKPFLQLKRVAQFEDRDQADQAGYAEIVKEPNVSVALSLKVFDWQGMSEIVEGEEEEEEFDG